MQVVLDVSKEAGLEVNTKENCMCIYIYIYIHMFLSLTRMQDRILMGGGGV
jgi:hypothetical protein